MESISIIDLKVVEKVSWESPETEDVPWLTTFESFDYWDSL